MILIYILDTVCNILFTMFNFMFNFSMLDRFLRLGRLMLLKASTDIFVSLSLSFLETSGGVTSSVSLSLSELLFCRLTRRFCSLIRRCNSMRGISLSDDEYVLSFLYLSANLVKGSWFFDSGFESDVLLSFSVSDSDSGGTTYLVLLLHLHVS